MKMEGEYNERTCITAGELRAMGAQVPDSIPDCGWVPKHTMKFGEPAVSMDEVDSMMLHVNTPVTFTAPFRWVSVDIALGDTPKDCRP